MAKQTYKGMLLDEVRRLERELERTQELLEQSKESVRLANQQINQLVACIKENVA